MNIVVGFKIVPDDQMIKIVGDKLVTDAPLKVSTYDKNAIEESVRLKEKFGGKGWRCNGGYRLVKGKGNQNRNVKN